MPERALCLDRRRFLQGTAALGLSLACAQAFAQSPKLVYDVVVVGAGGAGLAAAVSAAQAGASVCVLEKMSSIGGDTQRSAGFMAVVDPDRQQPWGIEDSFDLHVSQTLRTGHDLGNPQLVRQMVEKAPAVARWLEAMGVMFEPRVYEAEGTGLRRCIRPIAARGDGYIRALSHEALRLGVEIYTEAAVMSLAPDLTGAVRGVTVRLAGSTFPKFVSARNGVILATGGFGASDALVRKWAPELAELPTDSSASSTGDGLLMAGQLGAQLECMEHIECVTGVKSEKNIAVRLAAPADMIYVNDSGERFAEENEAQDALAAAIRAQHDGRCFVIFDSAAVASLDPLTQKSLYRALVADAIFSAPSLEKLAEILKIPAQGLRRSIETYNSRLDSGEKSGKCRTMPCKKIRKSPFWGYEAALMIHNTAGGLKIDVKGRVLKTSGEPIAGLWAAGAVTGSVHGANCSSGNGLTDVFVMGKITGEQVALAGNSR